MRAQALFASLAISVGAVLGSSPAPASTYLNYVLGHGYGGNFGSDPGSITTFGQVFTAPESQLDEWGFLINTEGDSGNAKFVLANWDGTAAVGPALVESGEFALQASSVESFYTLGGIFTHLTVGKSYVAYFTVAGVSNPIGAALFGQSSQNGGLSGGDTFADGGDPLTSAVFWDQPVGEFNGNFIFDASFSTPVTTPVPAALPLFATALGGVGFLGWRRKQRA
jgi:hypothetical protein